MRRLLSLVLPLAFAVACAEAPEDDHGHGDMTEADVTAAFEAAHAERTDGKEDGPGCSGVKVPDSSGFNKRIALTFDDGPNPETTPDVIAVLRKHGVPAAFFINGSRAGSSAAQEILEDIVSDPSFILANHTWSHVNMAQQGASEVARQIDRTAAVIDAAGGENKWFRFPFGSSTCTTAEAVRSRGLISTGWHIDSADWCYAAAGGYCRPSTFRYVPDSFRRDMLGYVMSQVRSTQGGILLFHDIHRHTADHLDAILTALKADGYTFTRLDDVNTFPRLNGSAPRPQPFIGDACTDDTQCGSLGCHLVGGFCTASCEGYCPDASGKAPTFCVQDPTSVEPTGICVSQAVDRNGHCADLPKTLDVSADRYIGGSAAAAKTAEVCMPQAPAPVE